MTIPFPHHKHEFKGGLEMFDEKTLTDEEVVGRVKAAVRLAIEKQEAMGIDIVRYDPKECCLYILNLDGTRTIVKENVKRVRRSDKTSDGPKT